MNSVPPRSRGACLRCKVRKRKCDEAKPACQNCIKKNLACPGYSKGLRWSRKHEVNPVITMGDPSQISSTSKQNKLEIRITSSTSPSQGSPDNTAQSDQAAETPSIPDSVLLDESLSWNLEAQDMWTKESTVTAELDNTGIWSVGETAYDSSQLESTLPMDPATTEITTFQPNFIGANPSFLPFEDENQTIVENEELIPFVPPEQQSFQHPGSLPMEDPGTDIYHQPDGSARWRQLLNRYYRIPSDPPMLQPLQDHKTTLIEYYFKETCPTLSSFDSTKNPFRTALGRVWHDSPLLYFAIQSTAAAHASNRWPKMDNVGLSMRTKAQWYVQQEMQKALHDESKNTQLLLALVMLGISACWHDPGDIGFGYLVAARSLIRSRLRRIPPNESIRRNDQFFAEALMYWETSVSWVSDEGYTPFLDHIPPSNVENVDSMPPRPIIPHPWGGIAPEILILTAEVGRLTKYTVITGAGEDSQTLQLASRLEEELLSVMIPNDSAFLDVEDEFTNKSDFIALAQANRCAALLQIYRVFPRILSRRLSLEANTGSFDRIFPGAGAELYEMGTGHSAHTSWLTSLAMHILDLLETIPNHSGVRCVQMMALTIAGFELRYVPCASYSDAEVRRARGFALGRLQEYTRLLPGKPFLRVVRLLQEVWRRNDAGESTFWLKVMFETNLRTVLG